VRRDEIFMPPMIASLPMYDLPEIRTATDALWDAIARELGTDLKLTRVQDWAAAWRCPRLLFSQTCGYPFTHEFAGKLSYVATPHYDAEGCEGPLYCSMIFARAPVALEQLRGSSAAYNNADSMSGMLALKLVFAPFTSGGTFFRRSIETGSHVGSLGAVQSGKADVCAVDCVTVALLRQHRPSALAGLVEIARSPHVPALPYVTRQNNAQVLGDALNVVFNMPEMTPYLEAMLLKQVSVLPPGAYDIIPQLERAAKTQDGIWS
jgi:ABC-type phosphate/phosphonate transport system substrate-binding protein